ncbi:MAG: hypothetical protein N0E58_17415 [Candidatus Thiodiazotropha endolucinida]|uniref:Uncharacterized protein n=1 Tax=Candidatus Thiodiazotropha taylori TaxID=2792791 RepID=A0A9E4NME2_9GAMM|nr:hypothetical protein [Candidatus Thiodiazotropha taylori]MCW4238027.1 hypothetical protein [Candidatus Thiodiazotropha endolucinida]
MRKGIPTQLLSGVASGAIILNPPSGDTIIYNPSSGGSIILNPSSSSERPFPEFQGQPDRVNPKGGVRQKSQRPFPEFQGQPDRVDPKGGVRQKSQRPFPEFQGQPDRVDPKGGVRPKTRRIFRYNSKKFPRHYSPSEYYSPSLDSIPEQEQWIEWIDLGDI